MPKPMKIAAALLVALSLFASCPAHAEETAFARVLKSKTIRCGYFTWPPYIAKDPNTGQLSGINYDVMNAIGKNLGLKVEWAAEIGVGDVVAALDTNKVDVMCASVWPNPARAQNLSLTGPTFFSIVHAFTRAGDTRFDGDLGKADRKDVRVSVIEGDITQDLSAEKLPSATPVALPQTASGSEILLQLVTGKADIVLVDQAFVNDFLKTNPGALRRVEGIPAVRVFGEHLAVKRGEYQLRDMLGLSIAQLTNDGVMEALARKYAAQYDSQFLPPVKTYAPVR